MKKNITLIVCIITCLALFAGCGGKTINLEEAKQNIAALKNDGGEALYGQLYTYTEKELKLAYGIDTSLTQESLICFSEDLTKAAMFAILKPSADKYDTVKEQVESFLMKYEYKWTLYLPEQTAMVQNALVKEEDGYIIVIISENNSEVLKAIEAAGK